jgi:hypothetical protein
MRIYSDKLLAWHEILHTSYAAHVNPGRWLNRNLYKIKRTKPVILHSSSPIEFLQKNRKYYLYDNLQQNKVYNHIGNYIDVIQGINGRPDMYIYLPFTVALHDVIVIHEDIGGHYEMVLA